MKTHLENMKDLREDHDLNQAMVGEVLGISQQQYSNYENGTNELPLRHFLKLLDFYKVSADYFLGKTDCQQGVDGLNKTVLDDYSTGKLISAVLSLNKNNRKAVIDYTELLQLKEKTSEK